MSLKIDNDILVFMGRASTRADVSPPSSRSQVSFSLSLHQHDATGSGLDPLFLNRWITPLIKQLYFIYLFKCSDMYLVSIVVYTF